MRVLILEDALASREMLTRHVAKRGHSVIAVEEVGAALRAHEAEPFDLMLVDWMLPGMSGLEFCRRVRARPGGTDPALVMVTARKDRDDVVAALEAGATDYLIKPFEPADLDLRLMVAEGYVREAQRRRKAEAQLHALADNIPGMVWQSIVHPDGECEFQYLSDGFRDLLDIDEDEGEVGPERLFGRLEDPEAVRAELLADSQALRPRSKQHRIALPDGGERWLHIQARPTALGDGRVRWDGVAVDITEQKRVEEALRRSEANFRALTESSPDLILVQARDRLRYVNAGFLCALGYDRPEDLAEGSALVHIHPQDREHVGRMRRTLQETGGPTGPREVRFRRQDGAFVPVEAVGMAITYEGEPAALVIGRDVTERHRMQAQLMATDRMASVGMLAAGVAHELNNPLAYVLSNIRMLREELDAAEHTPQARDWTAFGELVDEAVNGVERIRSIVRDLKTFSRVEDEEHREIVEIEQVVDACLHMCRNEIRHRARIEKHHGHGPAVRMNEARLAQVVLNILLNATQALPEGHADKNRIIVRTGGDRRGAFIEVGDSGPGMAAEVRERIFDPFYTTKAQGQGTGLGLSICRNIVEAVGGEVSVDSELGCGTTVRVWLPAVDAPSVTAPGNGSPQRRSEPPARRLLIVDDEPLVGRALKRVLREHKVHVVSSGREAIDTLTASDFSFDLVLCDLMMPEVSGMEVYREVVQQRPELADRFVFMTGGAFTPGARQFLDRIDNARIEKPFDPSQVRSLVQQPPSTASRGDAPG